MGGNQSNEEYVRKSAGDKFNADRARLGKVRRSERGPQDPFRMNYGYLPWVPNKFDVAPSVTYHINPYLYRVDREYSNKPPFLQAYDRRLFRRQPNLFSFDPDYSTCTYQPPDPSRTATTVDPQRQPIDLDTLYRFRSPYRPSENPYGELTDPMSVRLRNTHYDADPYQVHFVDERGFFRPKTWKKPKN